MAINKDLSLKSFTRVPRHLLTEVMKQKRLERCKKLRQYLRKNQSIVKIFSDKKIFTVDQVTNRRNDRFIAETPDEVKGVYRTKHPAQVMVLGVLGSDGQKMPPYFFKAGEKIGTEAYYKVLRFTILPWLKASYPEGNYVWQQDGAPSHTSNRCQKFCQDNMASFWPKDFWPPSLPELNPLDFFLVGHHQEAYLCHTPSKCGISQGLHQPGMGQLPRGGNQEGLCQLWQPSWGCNCC
jgi:inhibitor of nuclear factor kappa-B kinase subunit alpha